MNTQSLKAALQNTDWSPVNVLNNVDLSLDRFWAIFKPIYDEQFPEILAKFNKNDHKINGFMTPELLDMRCMLWSLSSTSCYLYSMIITLRQWYFAQKRYSRAQRMFCVRSSSGRRSIARALLASTWLLHRPPDSAGSVTLWYGSGSADSYKWTMNSVPDPDPDPTLFFSFFQQDAKWTSFLNSLLLLFLLTFPLKNLRHFLNLQIMVIENQKIRKNIFSS